MNEKVNKKSSYIRRKTESVYNHYILQKEDNTFLCLIGVSKGISNDEIELLINAPLINCSTEFWIKFFKLSQPNRQIIQKALNEQHQKTSKNNGIFNTHNWNVFTDFLFSRYDLTLYDIAREIEGTGTIYSNQRKKATYDNLAVLQKVKTHPRKESLTLAKEICAYYLVTFDLITTGQGFIYSLNSEYDSQDYEKELSNYTFENVRKAFDESDGEGIDTKELLLKLTGLNEADISCIPIQIFDSIPKLDKRDEEVFMTLMDQME